MRFQQEEGLGFCCLLCSSQSHSRMRDPGFKVWFQTTVWSQLCLLLCREDLAEACSPTVVWVALFQGVGPYNPRDAATSLCKNKQWVWSQVNQRAGAYRLSCWGVLLLAVKLKQLCRGRGASKTSLLQTVQPVCVLKLRTKSWNTLKVYEYTSYFGDSCLAISFLWLSQSSYVGTRLWFYLFISRGKIWIVSGQGTVWLHL